MVLFNTMVSSLAGLLLLSRLWLPASSEGLRGVGGGGGIEIDFRGDDASPPRTNNGNSTIATPNTTEESKRFSRRRRRLGEDDLHHHASHLTTGEMTPRIIGGGPAQSGRYPYTVALTDYGGLFCGGSLITSDMVLTAAHCGDQKDYVKFIVGTSALSRGGISIFPKRGWIHEDYDWTTMDNDIMIYMLDGQVPIGGNVGLVTVNDNDRMPARMGDRLLALGWGDTNPGLTYQSSDDLLKVGVGYIPNSECTKRTGMVGGNFVSFNGQVRSNMLCALDRGKDGCQGDSGGPLVAEGSDPKGRRDVIVGLSSWGVDCAHATLPGVYTRVSTQYKWIQGIVCEFSNDPPASFGCRNSGGGGGGGPKPGGIKPRPNPPTTPKPKPPPIFQKPNPPPAASVPKPRPPSGPKPKPPPIFQKPNPPPAVSVPKPRPPSGNTGPRPNNKPKPNNKPSVSKPKPIWAINPKPNNNNSKPKPNNVSRPKPGKKPNNKPGRKPKKKKKKKKKNNKDKMNYLNNKKNKQRITQTYDIFH